MAGPPLELRTVSNLRLVLQGRVIKKTLNQITQGVFLGCDAGEVPPVPDRHFDALRPEFSLCKTLEGGAFHSTTLDPDLNLIACTVLPIAFSDAGHVALLASGWSETDLNNNLQITVIISNMIHIPMVLIKIINKNSIFKCDIYLLSHICHIYFKTNCLYGRFYASLSCLKRAVRIDKKGRNYCDLLVLTVTNL